MQSKRARQAEQEVPGKRINLIPNARRRRAYDATEESGKKKNDTRNKKRGGTGYGGHISWTTKAGHRIGGNTENSR